MSSSLSAKISSKRQERILRFEEELLENVIDLLEYQHKKEQMQKRIKKQGALNAMMSGSGPTVFGLYETKEKARKAAAKIREKQLAKQVYVTGIHNARRK